MTASADLPIGVIGLGIMGGAIARNLARAGYDVLGVDLVEDRLSEARASGVRAVASTEVLAGEAHLILTCLPTSAALELTVSAIMAGAPKTAAPVVGELSTLPLDVKRNQRDRLASAGIPLLDCPLSGTGAQAATGDLAVYASGDQDAWDRAKPVFDRFARVCHYLGPFGNGMKMKLVANLLVAIHNVAAAEAVLLGLRAGLDPASLVRVAGAGAGASRMLELRGPMMVDAAFTPATMKLGVWQKDMELIADFAAKAGVPTPLFDATGPLYAAALADGLGEQDTAAVFSVLAAMERDPGHNDA